MVEYNVVFVGCGVNLTKSLKKIRRNVGADYKGYWHDESHVLPVITF